MIPVDPSRFRSVIMHAVMLLTLVLSAAAVTLAPVTTWIGSAVSLAPGTSQTLALRLSPAPLTALSLREASLSVGWELSVPVDVFLCRNDTAPPELATCSCYTAAVAAGAWNRSCEFYWQLKGEASRGLSTVLALSRGSNLSVLAATFLLVLDNTPFGGGGSTQLVGQVQVQSAVLPSGAELWAAIGTFLLAAGAGGLGLVLLGLLVGACCRYRRVARNYIALD